MSVTACLLNYKRPKELTAIIESLQRLSFINEILVHDNSTGENVINYGRYVAARRASNPIIYTQDDDCIVQNVGAMYRSFDGSRLVNGMKRDRMPFYRGKDTMLGWGAFFRVEWIAVLDRYIARFGKDHLFYRETDRIFTALLEVPRLTVAAKVRDFPSANAPFSLSRQPDHESAKSQALERCRALLG